MTAEHVVLAGESLGEWWRSRRPPAQRVHLGAHAEREATAGARLRAALTEVAGQPSGPWDSI